MVNKRASHIRDVKGRFVSQQDIAEHIADLVADLASVKRAAFWYRMYREDLYKSTLHCARLAKKLNAAQSVAWGEVRDLESDYGVYCIDRFLHRPTLRGLAYAPGWGGYHLAPADIRVAQMTRRRNYWRQRGNTVWMEYWDLRWSALCFLREKWPLSPAALARTKRYLIAQDDQMARDKIENEAAAERREIEAKQQQRRAEQAITEKANALLVELVPEIRVTKRMRKAQAFDVLIQLMERSDVDPKTKEAIGRLRESVEGEHATSGGVH